MKKFRKVMLLCGVLGTLSTNLLAATSDAMVWEKPAQQIANSIKGPVAMAISLISVVVAGLAWSFTDGGNMMGKAIKIVLGIVIAFGAGTLIANVFGGGGAAGMLL